MCKERARNGTPGVWNGSNGLSTTGWSARVTRQATTTVLVSRAAMKGLPAGPNRRTRYTRLHQQPVTAWARTAAVLLLAGCGTGTDGAPVTPPATPTAPSPEPVAPPAPVLQAWVSVYSVPSPYSGNYTEGMWIRLIAEFEEPVRVNGSPRLAIKIGEAIRHADFSPYELGHRYSTPEHRVRGDYLPRFDYLVRADDIDNDGFSIGVDAFDFTGGALLNEAGVEVEVEIYSVTPTESDDGFAEPGLDLGSHPVDGMPRLRRCTDELERARGGQAILIEEWDGTPFLFYFSLVGLPEAERADAERVLEAAERLSDRIKDQIGYSILEVGGWSTDPLVDFNSDCDWRQPRKIFAMVVPGPEGPARAKRRCGIWASEGTDLDFGAGTVSHELFHLFGFEHHPENWRSPGQYDSGVFMSNRLSGVYVDEEDVGVSFEDVDALRCIFPKAG